MSAKIIVSADYFTINDVTLVFEVSTDGDGPRVAEIKRSRFQDSCLRLTITPSFERYLS